MFGVYFAFMGCSLLVGVISGQIVGRLGVYRTVMLGNSIALFGGLLMAAWYLCFGLTIAGFVVPMLPLGIGGTMAMGSGVSGAMEPFAKFSGAASATLGFIQFGLSGLIGAMAAGNHVT